MRKRRLRRRWRGDPERGGACPAGGRACPPLAGFDLWAGVWYMATIAVPTLRLLGDWKKRFALLSPCR
jgi:hypothetical protein